MRIEDHYNVLQVSPAASDEEVIRSFKRLALQYHPDRNRNRQEWAHEAMTRLNVAYSTIMSHRFTEADDDKSEPAVQKQPAANKKPAGKPETRQRKPSPEVEEYERERLIQIFIHHRETAKDYIYRFYQYGLHHLPRREQSSNQGTYRNIVLNLRRAYHGVTALSKLTKDRELLDHFSVFTTMIFDFYRSAECMNMIDSYTSQREVDAYRLYRAGDEFLHKAAKELFFDRHNRGFIKHSLVDTNLAEALSILKRMIQVYTDSSWSVESRIKLSFAISLRRYVDLFFTGEEILP